MTETTTVDPKDALIDPAEWKISVGLSYKGVTYGTPEAVPVMTVREAEQFEQTGQLYRIDSDGTILTEDRRPQLETAEDYLRGRDEVVLKRLLDYAPGLKTLKEMRAMILKHGRSKTLELAIELAIRSHGGGRRRAAPDR